MSEARSSGPVVRRDVREIARGAARLPTRVFDALFPPCCVLCARSLGPDRTPLCPMCRHRLPRVAPPLCPRCGATDVLGGGVGAGCPACWDWPDDLPAARSPYLMEGGAAELVRSLKYGGWSELAGPMGRSMARSAARLAEDVESTPVLVPVPLSPTRLRERGFNQAELLARALADATGWKVTGALRRRPGGRRQASLGRSERLRNVGASFTSSGPAPTPGAPALLVDDVLTTGATATACSSALEGAGWTPIGTVVFARALHPIPWR